MSALTSKPGLTSASITPSIPKDWNKDGAKFMKNLIGNQLQGADVRNAVGTGGITVSGNLTAPYATIGFKAPIILPGPVSIVNNGAATSNGASLMINVPAGYGNASTSVGTNSGYVGSALQMGGCEIFTYPGSGVNTQYSMYLTGNLIYNSGGTGQYVYQTNSGGLLFILDPSTGWRYYSAPTGVAGANAATTEYARFGLNGGLTLFVPASGPTLACSANGSNDCFQFDSGGATEIGFFGGNNTLGGYFTWIDLFNASVARGFFGFGPTVGGTFGSVTNATCIWRSQGDLQLCYSGATTGLAISTQGVVTVTNGSAIDNTFVVLGSAAGHSAIRINTSATTGAATPTLTANKPGSSSGVATWLPINLDGNVRYIPCWS